MTAASPAELEEAAAQPAPAASEIAGSFVLSEDAKLTPAAERESILAAPGFGSHFTDHLAHECWTADEGWHDRKLEPYGPVSLDPAGAILHYGQEVFEGLKVYRRDDGSLWTFRPLYNAERFNYSGARMAVPEFPVKDFLGSIVDLARIDADWIPGELGAALYMRPYIFASEAFLGVHAASRYEYYLIASPVQPYFGTGMQAINLWVEREYHRAGPGGMGEAKTAGNYAASLLPKVRAAEAGYDEVMFLDAKTDSKIDELGGMNVFVVYKNGSLRTPELNGNILPGNTRSSIIQLARARGIDVVEAPLVFDEVAAGVRSGAITEMFACGTAAVIAPIGSLSGLGSDGNTWQVDLDPDEHPVTSKIYDELTGIQYGSEPDEFGWMYQIA